jgi:hypothetical protein
VLWAVDGESGGPDLAQANGSAAKMHRGGARRRRAAGSPAQIDLAPGCTIRPAVGTRATSTRSRTQQGLPEAATTARCDPRRATAAAGLRRARHGDVGHRHAFKGHRRHPYLAAEMRGRQHDDGRRRRLGSTAAAARSRWRRREALGLGFWRRRGRNRGGGGALIGRSP